MIKLLDYVVVYFYVLLFQVYKVAGCMRNFTLYGYKQIIIMTVPVWIGTFAKYFCIFLFAPFLAVHPVRRIKMFFACNMYHHNK